MDSSRRTWVRRRQKERSIHQTLSTRCPSNSSTHSLASISPETFAVSQEAAHEKEISTEDIAHAQRTNRKQQFSATSFDRRVNVMSESFGAENGDGVGERGEVSAPYAVNYEVIHSHLPRGA